MEKCNCIKSDGRRCQNEVWREIKVFQENEHPKIGTGWFWVKLCEKHFFSSNANAIVKMKGRQEWRDI